MKVPLMGAALLIGLGCASSKNASQASHQGPGSEAGEGGTGASGSNSGGKSGGDARGGASGTPMTGGMATAGASGGSAGTAGSGGASGASTAVGGAGASGVGGGSAGVSGVGGAVVPDLPHRACAPSALQPEDGCSGAEAMPIANPTTLADEMHNLVLESEWRTLWGVVGQYACGDAPVYRGSLELVANEGEEDWPDALASLVMGDGLKWIAANELAVYLTVFDRGSERKTQLVQKEQGITETSIIVGPRSSFGVRASCTDCFANLGTRPSQLDFDYVANGQYGDGTPFVVKANGALSQVPLAELTFSDILTVTKVYSTDILDIMDSFEPCGAEITRRSVGEFLTNAEAPAGSGYEDEECRRRVAFSAIWHLDAVRPAAHGIRALTLEEPRLCCQGQGSESGPAPVVCFDP